MIDPFEEIKKEARERYFLLFFVLPAAILLHTIFFFQNSVVVKVKFFFVETSLSSSFIILNSIIYGFFVASLIFMYRQSELYTKIHLLEQDLKSEQDNHKSTRGRLDKLKTASHDVLVPYHLDKLVENNMTDYVSACSKPGMLRANLPAAAQT